MKIYDKDGGTLISARFITTTRFIFNFRNQVQLKVQLGASKLKDSNRDFYDVEKLYKPQDEKYVEYRKDITLLQLSNEVVIIYTDFVRPVCLPKADIEIEAFGTAIGFGVTEERKLSTDLRMVQLPTIDSTRCKNLYPYEKKKDTFCAGYWNNTYVCTADEGGGFHFKGYNDEWYIGGVTFIDGCLHPGLFTNVFKYLPWIQSVMNSKS